MCNLFEKASKSKVVKETSAKEASIGIFQIKVFKGYFEGVDGCRSKGDGIHLIKPK